MEKLKHNVWIPLIGFDNQSPDKGVEEYIENAGFVPEGVSVFLFHSDIVNHHAGMDKEFILHPDNCSYYGVPRNEFRERQPWTNYDLKELAHQLCEKGITAYLGIMGVYLDNTHHYEWESDHKELMSYGVNGRMNLNVLKRFKDGTYYEDFFLEKIVNALNDYGFSGLHVADFFCPPEHSICNGDFSSDMLMQFQEHSGVKFADDIASRLDFDEQSDIEKRQKYIWYNLRQEWIEFYVWRWQKFWGKICAALHKNGKKIMINNAWASDPFEAIYRYGLDYKKLYEAGVDVFAAETLPDGSELLGEQQDIFNKYLSMAQLMNVYSPGFKLLNLLGIKDCTEEWDIIHHSPTRLDRIMHAQASLYTKTPEGFSNSANGYMITLGDGITKDEWDIIRERASEAYQKLPSDVLCPTLIWSDYGNEKMLSEYIRTRRCSVHKLMYSLKDIGASIGAVARTEDLNSLNGAIFVPNFDLMSSDEQESVISYKKAPVIGIASYEFMKQADFRCDILINDSLASYQLCVFVLNCDKSRFNDINLEIRGEKIIECEDVSAWEDPSFFLSAMPMRKVSSGFIKVCKDILNAASTSPFKSDSQLLPLLMEDGMYRVYVFNNENKYLRAKIYTSAPPKKVVAASKYPVMPVRYIYPPDPNAQKLDGAKADSVLIGVSQNIPPEGFIAKVPPCGVAIFDIEF